MYIDKHHQKINQLNWQYNPQLYSQGKWCENVIFSDSRKTVYHKDDTSEMGKWPYQHTYGYGVNVHMEYDYSI
jgi:hypothetical protein